MTEPMPHLREIERGIYTVINWRKQKSRFQVGDVVRWNWEQCIISLVDAEYPDRFTIIKRDKMKVQGVPGKDLQLIKPYEEGKRIVLMHIKNGGM